MDQEPQLVPHLAPVVQLHRLPTLLRLHSLEVTATVIVVLLASELRPVLWERLVQDPYPARSSTAALPARSVKIAKMGLVRLALIRAIRIILVPL